MNSQIANLLEDCTVRLHTEAGYGTGFFVAPGLILTCAHVVGVSRATKQTIEVIWRTKKLEGTVERVVPEPCPTENVFPDLALISVVAANHPCVLLDEQYRVGDPVYAWGHSDLRPGGESLWGVCEGEARYDDSPEKRLIKIKATQVRPGISGAPLLNWRTGAVCGMVKRTRDEQSDLGGLAIRIGIVLTCFPDLLRSQQEFHSLHQEWRDVQPKPITETVPYQAPPLTRYFIGRHEGNLLKNELLTTGQTFGVLAVSALQGLPGIGKTTLIASVAADPEVRARFRNGVLWASLGQKPELLPLLGSWITALGSFSVPQSVDDASKELRTILQDKSCLLVLDDVWSEEHAKLFLAGGSACRMVITTRRATVAERLESRRIELKVLDSDQALQVLSSRLNRTLEPTECATALRVASLVGFLPLALEQAAVRVRSGMGWDVLYQALSGEIGNLGMLGDAEEQLRGETRLEAAFNLSLKFLRAFGEHYWQKLIRLAVFPEDSSLSVNPCGVLWGTSAAEAGTILEFFHNEALLQRSQESLQLGLDNPSYRMHDVVHDIVRKLLVAAPPKGLGVSLRDLNREFLAAYRYKSPSGSLSQLPDDGYCYSRFGWHLEAGELSDQLYGLIDEERERENAWYCCREKAGQLGGYIDDVQRASRLAAVQARVEIQEQLESTSFARTIRFALICSSITSQATQIPVSLLRAIAKHEQLPPEHILAYARQLPSSDSIPALVAISKALSRPFCEMAMQAAVDVAMRLESEEDRSWWFQWLAPTLSMSSLETLLRVSRHFEDEKIRDRTIEGLIPRWVELGEEKRALEEVKGSSDKFRVAALFRMAPLLSLDGVREGFSLLQACAIPGASGARAALAVQLVQLGSPADGIAIAQDLADFRDLSYFLEHAAPNLYGPELANAIALLPRIEDEDENGFARLSGLLSRNLALETSETFLGDTLKKLWKSETIDALIPSLPLALIDTLHVRGDSSLVAVACRLAALGQITRALEFQGKISDVRERSKCLCGMADFLGIADIRHIIQEAAQTKDEELLRVLLTRLTELGYAEEALENARQLGRTERETMLSNIACLLPTKLLRPALQLTRTIEDWRQQMSARLEVSANLSDSTFEQLLETLKAKGAVKEHAPALADIVNRVPSRAVTVAHCILPLWKGVTPAWKGATAAEFSYYRDQLDLMFAIAKIAPLLSDEYRHQIASRISQQTFYDVRVFPEEFADLVRYLNLSEKTTVRQKFESLLRQAKSHSDIQVSVVKIMLALWGIESSRKIISKLERPRLRTKARAILSGLVPSDTQISLVAEIMANAENTRPEPPPLYEWAIDFAEIANCLPAPLLLRAIEPIQNQGGYRGECVHYIPHLARIGRMHEALQLLERLEGPEYRSVALAKMAKAVSADESKRLLIDALRTASRIRNASNSSGHRAETLREIADDLCALSQIDLLDLLMQVLPQLALYRREELLLDMAALTPVLLKVGGSAAMADIDRSIVKIGIWWP